MSEVSGDTGPPSVSDTAEGANNIRYGKSTDSDIQTLDRWLPNLKEQALRLLIKLRALTKETGSDVLTISTAELATRTNNAKSAIRRALTELASLNLITVRAATATRPTIIQVNAFKTAQFPGQETTLGVPFRGTPPAFKGHTGRLFEAPPVPFEGTPPTENTALTDAEGGVEISTASQRLIDRVLSAQPKDFDANVIVTFRNWLHGYMCKLGRDDRNQPTPHAHPPKDDLVAQFLAIGDPHRLGAMLDSLMLDRKTCCTYGWFVTLALQRIHGIHHTETKKVRAHLAEVRRAGKPAPDPEWQQETFDAIKQIAGTKKLR